MSTSTQQPDITPSGRPAGRRLSPALVLAAVLALPGSMLWADEQAETPPPPAAADTQAGSEQEDARPDSGDTTDDQPNEPAAGTPRPPAGAEPPVRPRTPADQRPSITQQRLDEVLEILDELDPQLAAEIRRGHQVAPERTMEALRPHLPTVRRMMTIKARDPEGYRFRVEDYRYARETGNLAQQLMQAERDEQPALARRLRRELESKVAGHFELRQQWREHEVRLVEQRIEQMRRAIENRRQQRQQIIRDKVEELTGQSTSPDF